MGGKGARLLRNIFKGHMEKTKWGGIKGVSSNSWVGGTDGRKMESTVLEQQKKCGKKMSFCFSWVTE